jgi:hypothetical protein
VERYSSIERLTCFLSFFDTDRFVSSQFYRQLCFAFVQSCSFQIFFIVLQNNQIKGGLRKGQKKKQNQWESECNRSIDSIFDDLDNLMHGSSRRRIQDQVQEVEEEEQRKRARVEVCDNATDVNGDSPAPKAAIPASSFASLLLTYSS